MKQQRLFPGITSFKRYLLHKEFAGVDPILFTANKSLQYRVFAQSSYKVVKNILVKLRRFLQNEGETLGGSVWNFLADS